MNGEKAIGFQIKELSLMFKRSLDEHINALQIDEMTGVQSWIIGYIHRQSKEKDVFQKDIEKAFHIRRSTVAETLRLMEKKGLVTRENVVHDGRLKKLVVTPKAIEIQEQITIQIEEVEKKVTKGLSNGELMLFLEILDKMKNNLNSLGDRNQIE